MSQHARSTSIAIAVVFEPDSPFLSGNMGSHHASFLACHGWPERQRPYWHACTYAAGLQFLSFVVTQDQKDISVIFVTFPDNVLFSYQLPFKLSPLSVC